MTELTHPPVDVPRPPDGGPQPARGLTKFLDPLRIPPVLRPDLGQDPHHLTVELQRTEVLLHSELPPTTVWAYAGHFPGPTIEVHRGHWLQVTWKNQLCGPYPLVAVEVPRDMTGPPGPTNPFPQVGNEPGREGAPPNQKVADLPPWTVVHLHGARTDGSNDGLPENAVLPGQSQVAQYANDQRAATLWYHDHAMDITRLNVVTGLVGMYLVRDDEEHDLKLPCGRYEIPLVICDRNLDTDARGRLTGQLLYKVCNLKVTIPGGPPPFTTMLQYFGPYTTVNGVIWPHLDVEARWYRFRVLNASNSRFYRLSLLDEHNNVLHGAITQVGTDNGLLPEPLPIDGELILAPSERADILIDFSAYRGRRLRMVNTGAGQVNENPPIVPGRTDPEAGLVEPDVMQFRVGATPVHDSFTLPQELSPSFVRLTHDSLPHGHVHRWLVTPSPGIDPPHPELWEMEEVEDPASVTIPSDGVIQIQEPGREVLTLRRVARNYENETTFHVEHGAWEQWKFLNIAGGPQHPMHIHLVGFQALSRDVYDTSTFDIVVRGTSAPIGFSHPGTLDPNEHGWKDTIRVHPGEVVSVAAQFGGGTGRFVYHCHLLDHEDEGMMRPFLVMPTEVMALKPHLHDSHHHG
ncbi:MAG: multicopper oxidase family protein [Pseudonocardiaceae bacterium]